MPIFLCEFHWFLITFGGMILFPFQRICYVLGFRLVIAIRFSLKRKFHHNERPVANDLLEILELC
jgi:hypothetical protein